MKTSSWARWFGPYVNLELIACWMCRMFRLRSAQNVHAPFTHHRSNMAYLSCVERSCRLVLYVCKRVYIATLVGSCTWHHPAEVCVLPAHPLASGSGLYVNHLRDLDSARQEARPVMALGGCRSRVPLKHSPQYAPSDVWETTEPRREPEHLFPSAF